MCHLTTGIHFLTLTRPRYFCQNLWLFFWSWKIQSVQWEKHTAKMCINCKKDHLFYSEKVTSERNSCQFWDKKRFAFLLKRIDFSLKTRLYLWCGINLKATDVQYHACHPFFAHDEFSFSLKRKARDDPSADFCFIFWVS